MPVANRSDDQRPYDALRSSIAALAPWFHNIDLNGVATAPDHFLGNYPADKFARFASIVPADLTGKSVLDIGCNAGFYSVEMKRRGAERVVGIDSDDRYLAQARLATDALGFTGVEFRNLSVYDVAALGETFDLVIFMGVLYHLRHPLLALDLIREHVARDAMLFQTLQLLVFGAAAAIFSLREGRAMTSIEAAAHAPALMIFYALQYSTLSRHVPDWAPVAAIASATALVAIYLAARRRLGDSRMASLQLVAACEQGDMPGVKWFLEKGASVKVCNARGATALEAARSRCNHAMIEYLLEHGDVEEEESEEEEVPEAAEADHKVSEGSFTQPKPTLTSQRNFKLNAEGQIMTGTVMTKVQYSIGPKIESMPEEEDDGDVTEEEMMMMIIFREQPPIKNE
jgi:methyltransferase (TIGR04290 family)